MKREFHIDVVCNYIFETELEDFAEYPSSEHVYYHALVVVEGKEEADRYLEEAIRDLNALEA